MPAEMFILRLEAAARPTQETLPSSNSQFVPFNPAGLPERQKGEVEPAANGPLKTSQ